MQKLVVLLTLLAAMAFGAMAWIFFSVRPKVAKTHELQQQLAASEQETQQLEAKSEAAPNNREESREFLKEGVTLFHQHQYNQAIALYDKALQAFPDDPYGWSLKGYALFRAGRIPESVKANERAVLLDPGDPLNFIDLAKSYCAAGQLPEAERVLTTEPTADVRSQVQRYLHTDGEIRRVCKPIVGRAQGS